MKNLRLLPILLFVVACGFWSCEDEDPKPSLEIPMIYSFENVSYKGQEHRIAMLWELKAYMAESQISGVQLNATRLKAMYENAEGADFSKAYTKQLKSKTFESQQVVFDALLEELAVASESAVAGAAGVSGVIESLNGEKSYLIGEDGLDHAQLIEKGLMGACFYYQATSVYMGEDRMNVDNEVVEPGEGTAMEHHWDEAFGYFGAPIDFPTTTDGIRFWADYSNKRNAVLASNTPLMNALLKGRAAISASDLAIRDEAITEARDWWEQAAVASALHYINTSLEHQATGDFALFAHGLSEAIGFTYSLKFNATKKLNNSQVDAILNLLGGASTFDAMNLYAVEAADLEAAKAQLAAAYGLEDKADQF